MLTKSDKTRATQLRGVLAAVFLAAAAAPAVADITIPVIKLIYSEQVLGPVVTDHRQTYEEQGIPSGAYNIHYYGQEVPPYWTYDYDTQELVTVYYNPPHQQVIQVTIAGGSLVVPPTTLEGLVQTLKQGGNAEGTLDALQQKPGQVAAYLVAAQQQPGLATDAVIAANGATQQSINRTIVDTYRASMPPKGDPVLLASGTFVSAETDFAIERLGVPVPQSRSYSSALKASGRMGPGWFYRYDTRIVMGTDSALEALAHQLERYYGLGVRGLP